MALWDIASARITPEESAGLDRVAGELGRTRNWVVRRLIQMVLDGDLPIPDEGEAVAEQVGNTEA